MLDDAARVARYQEQTGRRELTDRQQRRVNKQRRHQSPEAADRREGVAAIRLLAAQARKARLAGLTPNS